MKFDGDHNSPRPSFFLDSVVIFFHNTLQCESLLTEEKVMEFKGYSSLWKAVIRPPRYTYEITDLGP